MRVLVIVCSLGLVALAHPASAEPGAEGLRLSLPPLEGSWRPVLSGGAELRLAPEFAWGGRWVETPLSLSLRGRDPTPDYGYSRVWFEQGALALSTFSQSVPVLAIGGDGRWGSEFGSGSELRVRLGSAGPVQHVNLVGRVEAVSPSFVTRHGSARWRVGLEGLF